MTRHLLDWISLRTNEFWRQIVTLTLGLLAGAKAITSFQPGLHAWQITALIALALVTFGAGKLAWNDECKRASIVIKTPDELAEDNIRWISEQGHVVVVTRDMSWAKDVQLEAVLRKKAESSDLTIIAAKRTARLTELERGGATVLFRPEVPGVRFTALRFGTADCRMLVHHQKGKNVQFRQYDRSDFPVYWLCQDLISSYLSSSRSSTDATDQSAGG